MCKNYLYVQTNGSPHTILSSVSAVINPSADDRFAYHFACSTVAGGLRVYKVYYGHLVTNVET